jgi:hypothetical protein
VPTLGCACTCNGIAVTPCDRGDRNGDMAITALEIFQATQNSANPAIRAECGP